MRPTRVFGVQTLYKGGDALEEGSMKKQMPGRLRTVAMIVVASATLVLSSSACLAQSPAAALADTPVDVSEGTSVAISSIYLAPDLGEAEYVGSAMSAAIDLDATTVTDPASVSADDTPITIPPGTPTTMSCTSTVPRPETTVTLDTAVGGGTTAVKPTVPATAAQPVTTRGVSGIMPTAVVAGITSLPNGINAGGGGTADTGAQDVGLWALLALVVVLTIGLGSAKVSRRRGRI